MGLAIQKKQAYLFRQQNKILWQEIFNRALGGSHALPIPQKGSESEERGDEASGMTVRCGFKAQTEYSVQTVGANLTSMKARWSAHFSGADARGQACATRLVGLGMGDHYLASVGTPLKARASPYRPSARRLRRRHTDTCASSGAVGGDGPCDRSPLLREHASQTLPQQRVVPNLTV